MFVDVPTVWRSGFLLSITRSIAIYLFDLMSWGWTVALSWPDGESCARFTSLGDIFQQFLYFGSCFHYYLFEVGHRFFLLISA